MTHKDATYYSKSAIAVQVKFFPVILTMHKHNRHLVLVNLLNKSCDTYSDRLVTRFPIVANVLIKSSIRLETRRLHFNSIHLDITEVVITYTMFLPVVLLYCIMLPYGSTRSFSSSSCQLKPFYGGFEARDCCRVRNQQGGDRVLSRIEFLVSR